jgi:hypothetical protein
MFWTRLGGGEARRRGTGDIASEKREVSWFWALGLGGGGGGGGPPPPRHACRGLEARQRGFG